MPPPPLLMVLAVVLTAGPWVQATSPWRLPHGQLQEVFQRPTFRPRTTTSSDTRNSVASLDSLIRNSNGSSTPETTSKSYKTFYRVYYGTPPTGEHAERRGSTHEDPYAQQRPASQELEDVRSANDHFLHVRTHFRCGVPAPRVVKVQDIYPNPSREYLPRCAVLHRCGDDVGCCDNNAFHCVPKAVQEVALTFYVLSVSANPDSPGVSNSLEKLLFENHTECECQIIYDLPRSGVPRGHFYGRHTTAATTSTTTTTTSAPTTISTSTLPSTTTTTAVPTTTGQNAESSWRMSKRHSREIDTHILAHRNSTLRPCTARSSNPSKGKLRKCRFKRRRRLSRITNKRNGCPVFRGHLRIWCRECPVPFHRREYADGRCSCDCFDKDKPCLKVKRGKEPLEEVERRCVEVAHCHFPECEYGEYEYDSGRCPRRPDNFRRHSEGKGHHHSPTPVHRWNLLERD